MLPTAALYTKLIIKTKKYWLLGIRCRIHYFSVVIQLQVDNLKLIQSMVQEQPAHLTWRGGIYQAGLTFYVDVGYLNAHVITHILVKYVFYKAVSSKICRYLQNKNTQKTTQQKICSDANRNFMQVKHHRLGTNVREHYYKMEYFQRRILTVFSPTFCI